MLALLLIFSISELLNFKRRNGHWQRCLFQNSILDPHFFADPDPGKNLHVDPVPVPDPDSDPGGKGKK